MKSGLPHHYPQHSSLLFVDPRNITMVCWELNTTTSLLVHSPSTPLLPSYFKGPHRRTMLWVEKTNTLTLKKTPQKHGKYIHTHIHTYIYWYYHGHGGENIWGTDMGWVGGEKRSKGRFGRSKRTTPSKASFTTDRAYSGAFTCHLCRTPASNRPSSLSLSEYPWPTLLTANTCLLWCGPQYLELRISTLYAPGIIVWVPGRA